MVNINIQLSNRAIYTFIAMGIMLVLGIGVYAYNAAGVGGVPATFGHSADELEGVCRTDGTGCPASVGVSFSDIDWTGSSGFTDGIDNTGSTVSGGCFMDYNPPSTNCNCWGTGSGTRIGSGDSGTYCTNAACGSGTLRYTATRSTTSRFTGFICVG